MSYPCQICHAVPPSADVTFPCIGKISDICRPTDEQFLTDQRASGLPCCNYAESFDGSFKSDDSRVGLFMSTFMSVYSCPTTPDRQITEQFARIRWARANNANRPTSANQTGLAIGHSGELPCSIAFAICFCCVRLVRNHLHHRISNKPLYGGSGSYGYQLIYEALVKRFRETNKSIGNPLSLYQRDGSDEVAMLGRAVMVRTTGRESNEEPIELPGDVFSQIPSMPRWFMSKLEPLDRANRADAQAVESTVAAKSYSSESSLLKLPMELFEQITWELDRPSIFALRLTHPILSIRLPLDQAFWCNELLYGEPPLLGYEPLVDNHSSRHPGEVLGRIDALSEVGYHYTKPRTRSKFVEAQEPAPRLRSGIKVSKRDWRDYDWKALVKLLATSSEFEDGGQCSDAPPGFCSRRRLWGVLDKLLATYT